MVFILTKNDNILTTCDNLDNVYYNILTYTKIILYCDKTKIDYFNDVKIVEYSNGYPINSYQINSNTLDLYNEKNEIVVIQNNILNKDKVELESLLKKDPVESDVNVFIPINKPKTINNAILSQMNKRKPVFKPVIMKKEETPQIEDQQKKLDEIRELKEKIEQEKNKLNNINANYDKKMNNYLETKRQCGLSEFELKKQKERMEQNRRIYISDKHVYRMLCKEIEKGTRDETDIPEIFELKFNVFQNFNKRLTDSQLSDSEGYEEYLDILSKLKPLTEKRVPTSYDNLFDDNPYNNKIYNNISDINSNSSSGSSSDTDTDSDKSDKGKESSTSSDSCYNGSDCFE